MKAHRERVLPAFRQRGALALFANATIALATITACASAAETARLAQVERTGDLICEFHKSGDTGSKRSPDLMLIVEQNRGSVPGTARLLSSRSGGAREARLYAGDTGVHLVENVASSVRVTTLLSCENESGDASKRRCTRYAAVNAWHFDDSVRRDPDAAFRKLPGTSYHGFCEAWHMSEVRTQERK